MPLYPDQSYVQPETGLELIDTHCHLDLEPLARNCRRCLQRPAGQG